MTIKKIKRKVSLYSLHSFTFLLLLSFPDFLSLLLLEAAFRNYRNQSKIWVILGNYCRRFYKSFPFAFSRNERAHPNFVCSREKSTFFVKTANWPPRPLDTKTKLGHFCSLCWLLSPVRRFERLPLNFMVFTLVHCSDCIRQKRECSSSVDCTEIF